jgi:transcriptional regulator with XRE-family HTH domain
MRMEPDFKDLDFASRLVRLRADLPLRDGKLVAIKDVADEAGINVGSYSRAENGVIPGEKVLNRIAKYYGVSVDYLLGKDEAVSENKYHPVGHREAKDKDGLFGRTKHLDVEGSRFAVTTHEPDPDNPFLKPMAMLTEILASGDPVLVPAIQANLRAFQIAVRRERQLTKYSQQLNDLQCKYEDVKKENTNLEERLAALERRLDEVAAGKTLPQDRNEPESDQPDPGKRAVA